MVNNTAVCVDGQHRLGAIAMLLEEGLISNDARMTVEVYHDDNKINDQLAAAVFTDINLAEPVKLCDLPNVMEEAEKKILDSACVQLRSKYKIMFKPTSNCRAPHVHLDTLRDHLFEFGIIRNVQAKTNDDLMNWLIQENNGLAKIKNKQWMAMRGRTSEKVLLKSLEKAKKYKFWLGMPGAMGMVLGRGK